MTGKGGRPARIVSLVPSITETIAWLGLLDRLVGRTRYCVEPAGAIEAVEAVGGTKNPDCARIIELAPDLVIVNREENRLEDFEMLRRAGLPVYVTHPRTVAEAVAMIVETGRRLGAEERAGELAADCRAALAAAAADAQRRPRAFCPIWRNPWMAFGRRTYIGDVLYQSGFDNVFDADEDFFTVSLDEVRARRPEIVLLPDEPYVFSAKHGRELHDAGIDARCLCVDGRDLSWYGPRIPRALDRLCTVRREHARP